MSKITKKLFDDYKDTKKVVKKSKFLHQQNIDKIIDIIKTLVDENYIKHPCHHNITSVEFCNDDNMKDKPTKYEWKIISEKKYDQLSKDEKCQNFYHSSNHKEESKLKIDYIYDGITDEIYYHSRPVKYEYLRVYVHESWGYGGNDDVIYDFLLSDIMDEQYLRKEKLEKLQNKKDIK